MPITFFVFRSLYSSSSILERIKPVVPFYCLLLLAAVVSAICPVKVFR